MTMDQMSPFTNQCLAIINSKHTHTQKKKYNALLLNNITV